MKLLRRFLETTGIAVWVLAWPAFFVYLRARERTRIIVIYQDQILVVRNWISDGKWLLPGGGLHKNEAVVRGALRELNEETGIAAKSEQLRFITRQRYRRYGQRFDFSVFVLSVAEAPVLHVQRHEISRIAWLKPEEILSSNKVAIDTRQAVKTFYKL